MADLNVSVKIGAEDLASGPLTQVAASLGQVQSAAVRAAEAVGGSGGGFTVQVNGMVEASKKAAAAHAEHGASLESLGHSLAHVSETALSFGLGMAGFQAAMEVFNHIKEAVIDLPEKFERSRISLETFTGSAQIAASVMSAIQALGTTDPFHTTALLDVATRLVALGTPAELAAQRVQDIATAVAAVGGSDEDLQRIAVSLARVQEMGTLTSRTMLQLVNEQIPAWQILEVGLGKTQMQLEGMLKAGEITSDVFNTAFHAWATSGDVADVLGKRADTAAGSMTLLSNALQVASVSALEPFTEQTNRGAGALATFARSGDLQRWGQNVGDTIRHANDDVGILAGALQRVSELQARLPHLPGMPQKSTSPTAGDSAALAAAAQAIAASFGLEAVVAAPHVVGDLDSAIHQLGRTLDVTTPAIRSNATALAELDQRIYGVDQAAKALAPGLQHVTEAVIDANAPVIRLSDAYEGQTLDAVRLVAANSALLDSYGKVGQAALAAAQAQMASRAAIHDTVAALQAQADTSLNSAYLTISPTDALIDAQKNLDAAAKSAGASLAGIGTSALASIPGLSALDLAIAGTQSKLAGVQLQIEEKVFARMSARPRVSLGSQEAYLQEELKIEQLQKAAGYSVPMEQLKISNAGISAANAAARASRSAGTHSTSQVFYPGTASAAGTQVTIFGSGSQVTVHNEADAAAVGQTVTNHLIALTKGGGSTPGRANVQLAGVR